MAIDTAVERRRALQASLWGVGVGFGYPLPDTDLDATDRAQINRIYYAGVFEDPNRQRIYFESGDGERVYITLPLWGYETIICMALKKFQSADFNLSYWDNGQAYDVRRCRCSFMLPYFEAHELRDFFNNPDNGRGQDCVLHLGKKSGFYPFGADLGDRGNFTVRIINIDISGQLHSPWKYWQVDIDMVLKTPPAYTLPTEETEGTIQIGTVSGLRYPQDGYRPKTTYAVAHVVGHGGTSYEVDRSISADVYTTELQVLANNSKMGALLDYLTTTARGDSFSIIVPDANFPYGVEQAASGTFVGKITDNELRIIHKSFERFEMILPLVYEPQAG